MWPITGSFCESCNHDGASYWRLTVGTVVAFFAIDSGAVYKCHDLLKVEMFKVCEVRTLCK